MDILELLCLLNIISRSDDTQKPKRPMSNIDITLTGICFIIIFLVLLYFIYKPLLFILLTSAGVFIIACFIIGLTNAFLNCKNKKDNESKTKKDTELN